MTKVLERPEVEIPVVVAPEVAVPRAAPRWLPWLVVGALLGGVIGGSVYLLTATEELTPAEIEALRWEDRADALTQAWLAEPANLQALQHRAKADALKQAWLAEVLETERARLEALMTERPEQAKYLEYGIHLLEEWVAQQPAGR
jgi:hypothetical protein